MDIVSYADFNNTNCKVTELVSVIVPNYNHSEFLKQRIDSVLNQSYNNFEVIILDDCSTDDSRAVLELYSGHPKISQIIYNNTNSGSPFKQWNKGVRLAKGEYIWIAESDDFADVEFVGRCMGAFQLNENAVLVYTDSLEVNESNELLGRWSRWQAFLKENIWQRDFTMSGDLVNSKYNCIFNVIPNASGALFKKAAYINSAFVQEIEQLKFTGDWLMWYSMLQQAEVVYCHEPLNYFRYHSNTTRSNSRLRLQKVTEHYEAILKFNKIAVKQPDRYLEEMKFAELYASWNPSLRKMLNYENLKLLWLSLNVDSKLILRLFRTFKGKLNAV